MKFKVTHHAQDRLDMRGIDLELVKRVLRNPKSVIVQGGQCVAECVIEGKPLRVVHAKDKGIFTIITVYYVY
jgi:hypothetical protein